MFSERVRDAYARLEEGQAQRQAGNLKKAIGIFEALIDEYPDYVAALHTLGLSHMARGGYWPALSCFVRASMLNPGDWSILGSLAQCYLGLGANEMAARTLEQARTINAEDPDLHFTLGLVYDREREYELAVKLLQRAVSLRPEFSRASYSLGLCLTHLGNLEAAAVAFHRAHDLEPHNLGPISATADLPSGFAKFDVEAALASVKLDSKSDRKQQHSRVAFTRAHLHDRAGAYEQAWKNLGAANRPLRAALGERVKTRKDMRARVREYVSAYQPENSVSDQSADQPISLFILGVSRSGKTTAERILGNVSGVKRGYENPIVELATRRVSQEAGLLSMRLLGDLPGKLLDKFTDHYNQDLGKRAPDAKVFTNTHPGRISEVGRLAESISNARFIFVIRDRMDTALRIYMKQYREDTNVYAYDPADIFEEIDWYHDLQALWQSKFPNRCRTLRYETMIESPHELITIAGELCGFDMDLQNLPPIGDDRGCAAPYAKYLGQS